MEQALVECVPNFSEGRDNHKIKQITDVIEAVDNIRLLDVDPGAEMNRTVVTFIGPPKAVQEAAFQGIKKASELIDMTKHHGTHPRMGATDVCPFVPVSGITTEKCISLSEQVGQRVASELDIPVFLYEKSARSTQRENLATIRQGEYEGLEDKLKKAEWRPDFGPAKFNARSGATVIGVREFLIAYNINLNTRESKYATDIAFELREKGRSARRGNTEPFYFKGTQILKYQPDNYPCGSCTFDGKSLDETVLHCEQEHHYNLLDLLNLNGVDPANVVGNSVKKPGLFSNCKAIGWMVPEFERAQLSINLTNYKITSMQQVLEATRQMASERGLVVTGSEVVGMVPYPALLETGKFYLKKQGRSTGVPIRDILETAVQSLGLRDVADFVIKDRVLGLPANLDLPLIGMTVTDFVDEVSRESAAPGGGSIAALAGGLGAALSSMVANLTANRRGSEEVDSILNEAAVKAQELKFRLVNGIDADTNAFNAYMEARRLPAATEEQKMARIQAEQDGLKLAVQIPLQTAKDSLETIKIAQTVVQHGNPNSITDIGVGAQMGFAGVKGGIYNVLINLKDIRDQNFVSEMKQSCFQLEQDAIASLGVVQKQVESRLK